MAQIEPSRERTADVISLDVARDVFAGGGVTLTVDQRLQLGNVMEQAHANAIAEKRLEWEQGAARRQNRTHLAVAMITMIGAIVGGCIAASAYASHRTAAPPAHVSQADRPRKPSVQPELGVGATLRPGQSLVSANHLYRLTVQNDGNVVEYGPYGAIWDFYSQGITVGVTSLVMQQDCNLVGYGAGGTASTDTQGLGSGCILRLQNDGNAVIVSDGNYPIWDSADAMA